MDISTNGEDLAIVSTDGKLYHLGKSMIEGGEMMKAIRRDKQIVVNPIHILLPEPIKQVSVGHRHRSVLSVKGNVYLWGDNRYGQLGQDFKSFAHIHNFASDPRKLSFSVPISFITCQNDTTAAIDENGKLYRWGRNRGFIESCQYVGLKNIMFNSSEEKDGIISSPIQIGLNVTDSTTKTPNICLNMPTMNRTTIQKKFYYVAIGWHVTISTTSDGWVNIWHEDKKDFFPIW